MRLCNNNRYKSKFRITQYATHGQIEIFKIKLEMKLFLCFNKMKRQFQIAMEWGKKKHRIGQTLIR